MHLNHLEDNVRRNVNESIKIWKPFEVKPSPVIDVITRLKLVDSSEKPVSKKLQVPMIQESLSVLPKLQQKRKDCEEEEEVTLKKCLNILKNLKTKKAKRKIEAYDILKICFNSWIQYVKEYKIKKQSIKSTVIQKKTNGNHSMGDTKLKELKAIKIRKSKDQNEDKLNLFAGNKKICNSNNSIGSKTFKVESTIAVSSPSVLKSETESNVQIKNDTPKKVDLITTTPKTIPKTITNNKFEDKPLQLSGKCNKTTVKQEKCTESCIAKGKIIEQLKVVIQEQKKEIMLLRANMYDLQSQLKLKTVKGNFAVVPPTFDEKLKPALKTALTALQKNEFDNKANSKIDKSEIINKNLKHRQEHCKHLCEMTRMRKLRKEEEKANTKIELEEKERQDKEERKKLQYLKSLMEKQLAKENARIALAKRIQSSNLTEKAINHHNSVLIRKAFTRLKLFVGEITLKSDQCGEVYKRKLLRKVFNNWQQETCHLIIEKNKFANSFYNKKLMLLSWTMWRKVSISNDKIKSKL